MAAKKNSDELLFILPPLKEQCRKKARKTFGNFSTYVVLPDVDPIQNINAFYSVKRFCKFVCEWYLAWRPWQKEVLLCSLSGKCSVNQLSSLCTILEPVFHRDFMSRLHGRYPVKDLQRKVVHQMKIDGGENKGQQKDNGRRGKETDIHPVNKEQISLVNSHELQGECSGESETPRHISVVISEGPNMDSSIEGDLGNNQGLLTDEQEGQENDNCVMMVTESVKEDTMSQDANDKMKNGHCEGEDTVQLLENEISDQLTSTTQVQEAEFINQVTSCYKKTAKSEDNNTHMSTENGELTSAVPLKTTDDLHQPKPVTSYHIQATKSEELQGPSDQQIRSPPCETTDDIHQSKPVISYHIQATKSEELQRPSDQQIRSPPCETTDIHQLKPVISYHMQATKSEVPQRHSDQQIGSPQLETTDDIHQLKPVTSYHMQTMKSEELQRPSDQQIGSRLLETTDDIYAKNSCHMHTTDSYKQNITNRFFSASRVQTLGDMKANFPSQCVGGRLLSDVDQKCYKHRRWWSEGKKNKRLVSAHGIKLWNHFTKQLKEINERMDVWGDHERANLLSEVIKSSDPEQISFFAQCLIQRLKDHTDVSILPDQTVLKIFSKLDANTLCQVSQVCRRWRYLGEHAVLWKHKCFQLGLSKGIENLTLLIERSANNHCIDWKQAYQEVYKIFHELQGDRHKADCEGYDCITVNKKGDDWRWRQKRQYLASKILKARTESNELLHQGMGIPKQDYTDQKAAAVANTFDTQTKRSPENISPRSGTGDREDGLIPNPEDIECYEDDLTGGNLTLLEKSLLEISGENHSQNNEELALDIRPNKIQANNEMDPKGKHQYLTVAVEDVKSVKRVRKLQGHMDGVYSVQFDSKRCLTGSADRVLRMWDVRSGRGIRKMLGHMGGVRCVQFDNNKIISGSWDTTIMVWDIVKFTRLAVLHGHQGCVSCLRFNPRHIVSGSHDMTIRVWDVNTWECLHVLQGHTDEVTSLFLAGILVVTGSTDRTIKLWNIETGECLKTLVGHNSAVLSVQASRALVISGSEEGKIIFWDLESGSQVAIVQGHDGACNCLFVWRNHFLSGGGDHLVKQWDICTFTCLRTLQGHKGPVQCVKMNSRRILSSSDDGTVRIWDLEVPVQQIGRQFVEVENTLLPFDTLLQHSDNEEEETNDS